MRAYDCIVLLCATAIILSCVSSGAEARYWRNYGYHWYGRSWNGYRPNGDERQVEKQLPSTEPRNEPRNQGDFSAAIGQMIHTCEYRCKSYEICRLMASLKWSSRLSSNAMHWSKSEVRRLTSLNPLQPHVLKTFRVAFTNV